jgi:alkanesulfonate monooxygenase SsuD/methylene tetrahydromethanopterin reductase-like flavin-dependent oxidoreductase (luciferase family)
VAATSSHVGLVLGSHLAPEDIRSTARLAEELGFGELWLAEDYFFTGGISGAGVALAASDSIPVGLGIVSALVRHPALLAMEIATLTRVYPGRVRPGIGLGVPAWVEQMALMPRSPLRAMRECVGSVRRLLAGETLSEQGEYFGFRDVTLTYPAHGETRVWMGVSGPKMLELAGEVADGTVLSVLASPEYVRWARERIAAGQAKAGRSDPHPVTAFALFSVDRDGAAARRALRPATAFYLHAMPRNALTEVYGIADEAVALAGRGVEAAAAELPDRWLEDLVIAGDPAECAAKIRGLLEAGADSVALFPTPHERARELVELTAAEVLPRL